MDWKQGRRSSNVQDRRGRGGGGVGRLGLGGIGVVIVLSLLLGKNPMEMLGLIDQISQSAPAATSPSAPVNDEAGDFVSAILGETEDVWGAIFQQRGERYEQPRLILFSGSVRSACGGATSASGPFYCPGDHQVYLDTSFFDDMTRKLGGGGDFADAYVIAHEVGHHVQTLLGVSARVNQARRSGQTVEGDGGLLVRQELQADCLAGVWAYHAQQRHQWLEAGDVEEALNTATAIGDDRLQKQARGQVVPDAFTHGTSAQRVRWFQRGFASGSLQQCDTFAAQPL
ncbi:neutral zinc metallopeptidase [Sinimarinibacterium sp. CAU 1509]|uniref:KPN_02809 family neutral zinc metallopeptidase n=1 Tax=Sinimarinibacterium sp. CAU 1509 TaxID=2562283 RepID=UPI0010ACEB7E|nr:neutral zinc metallopeptidase [Sinimarinibacterium sp. CAU 1509]TJY59503.1 neutral zinc metallopeptidase [Sinimarinibacterium sp. CAU 1509]